MTPLRELVDAFGELMAQHVRLAGLEFKQDARYVGVRIALIATLAPLVLVGHGFLCVALALALRRVMADELAVLLVGTLNLMTGGIGIARVGRQLSARRVMNASLVELKSSSPW